MKYIYLSLICLSFIALSLSPRAAAAETAETAQYSLDVKDFKELKVTDNINVVYHASTDSAGWVYFSCPPEIGRHLIFTNKNNRLHIQVATEAVNNPELPVLHVYSRVLTKVENDSDSTLRVDSNVPVEKFSAKVVGNGTIIIRDIEALNVDLSISTGCGHIVVNKGSAVKCKISNVGTGPIEAGGLKCEKIKVMMLGTGPIDCSPVKELSVYGAGSGNVYYSGRPEKISNRSIGVKVQAIE